MTAELDDFRTETRTGLASLRTQVDGLRSELDDVRIETRSGVGETSLQIIEVRAETRERFDRVEDTVAEVLRRLPERS